LVFPPLTGENETIAKKMQAGQSVSIHVRRGDYLSAKYSDRFLSLDRSYYEPAVNIVREHFSDPEFYIFSEDPEFVEKEFAWLDNKTIVNINNGDDSFRDMQLMSKCKANIIANSTFSQWASILNENPGHITVYPAIYMSGEDTEDRKMPGWIRV
nr:alpha-1,2-fucosyltransferase [Lachnospiraceae bacterium]